MPETLIVLVVLSAVILAIREVYVFVVMPARAGALHTMGRTEAAIRGFEQAITTWSLLGDAGKDDARFRLSYLYMEQGRHEEAAALLRHALTHRKPPGVEANFRRRLADALENAGHREEAQAERARAAEGLAGSTEVGGNGVEVVLSRAKMLETEGKHAEAADRYAEALNGSYPLPQPAREQTLLRAGLASYNAGRPDDVVRYAEEALSMEPGLGNRMMAHSVAGLGYSSLGQLDKAEEHRVKALALAMQAGNKERAADYMLQLASIRGQRGKIVEAIQGCEMAAKLSTKVRRRAYLNQALSLEAWGRYDEARDLLRQARGCESFALPHLARRDEGVHDLAMADLECEAGNGDVALASIERAMATLGDEQKLAYWTEARKAWALAVAGRTDEARAMVNDVERRLPDWADDRQTQETVLEKLARATFAMGEFARSTDFWGRYAATKPNPVATPTLLYFRGECLFALGDTEAARADWTEAAGMGIDTRRARQAEKRLAETA